MVAEWKRLAYAEELGGAGVTLTDTAASTITEGASTVGVSGEAARADHEHGYTDPSPDPSAVAGVDIDGSAGAVGVSDAYARADHDHGFEPAVALDFNQQEIQRAVIHNAGGTPPDNGAEVLGQIYFDGTYAYVWADTA